MKKSVVLILVVLFLVFSLASCSNVYEKGVDYDDYPDKDVPIYDDAVVFSYESGGDKCTIIYGTEDDVDDVMEFYMEEFEDDDYHIYGEDIDDDEYSVEGIIDDITFEINVEEASGDMEEKYFDTVVEVDIIFDSNDYAQEDEDIKAEEESLESLNGENAETVSEEQSDESGGLIQSAEAMSALIEGKTYDSENGYITVELAPIDVSSGSDDYLYMESLFSFTNNTDDVFHVVINNTWVNGYSVGVADNFKINAGSTLKSYVNYGAYTYEYVGIGEIVDLFYYMTVYDEDFYEVVDEIKISVTNPQSDYVQGGIGDAPVVAAADEVTLSYAGYFSDEYMDYLVFYVVNNSSELSADNQFNIYLKELEINGTVLEDSMFYLGTYGDSVAVMECDFLKSDYSQLFESGSIVLNSAVLQVMDERDYSSNYYNVSEIVLE